MRGWRLDARSSPGFHDLLEDHSRAVDLLMDPKVWPFRDMGALVGVVNRRPVSSEEGEEARNQYPE